MSSLSGIIIKPEAWNRSSEILADLIARNFEIVRSLEKVLSYEDIEEIYFQSHPDFMRIARVVYKGKKITASVVAGADAQRRIIDVVGTHYNPQLCAGNSLRRKYAAAPIDVGGEIFFANAVHRPQGQEDNDGFLRWFLKNI